MYVARRLSRFEELRYQIQYHAAGSDVSCVLQIDVYKIWISAYDIIFANKYSSQIEGSAISLHRGSPTNARELVLAMICPIVGKTGTWAHSDSGGKYLVTACYPYKRSSTYHL